MALWNPQARETRKTDKTGRDRGHQGTMAQCVPVKFLSGREEATGIVMAQTKYLSSFSLCKNTFLPPPSPPRPLPPWVDLLTSPCVENVLSSHFSHRDPLSVLMYTLITKTAGTLVWSHCPAVHCLSQRVSLLMTSSDLQKPTDGKCVYTLMSLVRIKWLGVCKCVCVCLDGHLNRNQEVRQEQSESEGQGSDGAVECSELGSVACRTLPWRTGWMVTLFQDVLCDLC